MDSSLLQAQAEVLTHGTISTRAYFGPGRTALQKLLRSIGDEDSAALLASIEHFSEADGSLPEWGTSDMGTRCLELATILDDWYKKTGNTHNALVVEAIDLKRHSLALRHSGHSHRAESCRSLGNSLWMLYNSTGEAPLLTEAINLQQESLFLCPRGSVDRVSACAHLAGSLWTSYQSTGNTENLSEALDLQREALSLCPLGHPDRARSCAHLAVSLWTRYQNNGNEQLLIEVVELERETLALRPLGHPDRALSCTNLAASCQIAYKGTGNEQFLIEAIDLGRESLSLYPAGHTSRALACTNLATTLQTYYQSNGDDYILTEVIELQREALALCHRSRPNRAMTCSNLAGSLWTQYRATGDAQLLIEAIDLERESINLRPRGHPDRAASCTSLANTLRARYERTSDIKMLIEAIELDQESLSLRPLGHPDRALACKHLAGSLWMYYKRTDNDQFLIEAINFEREALSLSPHGHPDRAAACANLAVSLKLRYETTNDDSLLLEAISLQEECLSLRLPGHPDRALHCTNLAVSLQTRYSASGNEILLENIYHLCQESLPLFNPSTLWRCGSILAWLYLRSSSEFYNPLTAIEYLSRSLEHYPDNISQALTLNIILIAQIWDKTSDLRSEHYSALNAVYTKLVRLLVFLNSPVLEAQIQLQALQFCSHIGSEMFVVAILSGKQQSALEELEAFHGLWWSQRLHYRDPQLDCVPIELATALNSLIKSIAVQSSFVSQEMIEHCQTSGLTSRDVQHNHVTQFYAILREIRSLAGLERFMLGETTEVLRSVAAAHPVVVLVGAHGHFYALLLGEKLHDSELITLDVNEKDIIELLWAQHASRSHRGSTKAAPLALDRNRVLGISTPSWLSVPNQRMRYLWVNIVKPVFDHLGLKPSTYEAKTRPRLHWCLTGKFISLPLHAAGIYDGPARSRVCCADYVMSSYTPTITMLLRAQKGMSSLRRERSHIALVAEKQAHEGGLEVIHHVDFEADGVATIAKSSRIAAYRQLSGDTTVSGAQEIMQEANIVHLACHGVQESGNALQSGFCLGDGRLTISKLMDLKLDHAFLAFLSACETAKGDKNQPDQVMHLASAMLFTGFKAVVATLWAICDADGPKVARWFYKELFAVEIIDADTVALSLDIAVRKLRDSGVPLDRWAPFIHMGA